MPAADARNVAHLFGSARLEQSPGGLPRDTYPLGEGIPTSAVGYMSGNWEDPVTAV